MLTNNNLIEIIQPKQVNASNAIKRANFDLSIKGTTYQDSLSLLFADHMVFRIKNYQNFIYLRVTFTFTLIFTTSLPNNQHDLSIKFEKEADQIIIKAKELSEITPWRLYFERNVKQRGFHQTFKAIKKIGKGNFATVYLVQKKDDLKKYAVKAFSKECLESEEKGKESLMNEINVMKKLNHKNLMKMHSIYQTEHSIYIVLQILQGGSLSDRIGKSYKITPLQTKIIIKTLLQGLEVMHCHKIMHRDIKPQNILFRKENDVNSVIADFGLAQFEESPQYLFVRCGTPGFVAPEVMNLKDKNDKYGCACDIFSVGVILHMLFLKEPLFPGKKYQALRLNKICTINFEDEKYQQLHPMHLDLLKKLLEKDPSKRITANQALTHQYFKNQLLLSRQISQSHFFKIEPRFLKQNYSLKQCQSNPKFFQASEQKDRIMRKESCLKLSLKADLLGRKTKEVESLSSLISGGQKKSVGKVNGTVAASRFKRLLVQI